MKEKVEMRIPAVSRLVCTALLSFGISVASISSSNAQSSQADVIFVVDTSGSMTSVVSAFQSEMNSFADALTTAGIDFHIVVIADASLCIPAPLGSGNCTDDSNPGLYLHVPVTVGGNNALQQVMGSSATWGPFLRPNSNRTVVVLTDDDSTTMTAEDFNTQLLAFDIDFAGYKFHGIIDPVGSCGVQGVEYIELATVLTGGTLHDICGIVAGAGLLPALLDIATVIAADVSVPPPPPPPETTCRDSTDFAIDDGSAYVKAARLVRKSCKSDTPDCAAALAGASDALALLSATHGNVLASCP